ncbi:MAG: IS3 family transposase [Desulfosarcina sp.]
MGTDPTVIPDPEVPEKISRRKFTAAYKLRVLQKAEQCLQPGDIGVLLRREGLYSSHLTSWRRQRENGILQGLKPKKRGRKAKPEDPSAERMAQLEKENQRLKNRLRKAEIIIEAQKKNLGDSGHRTESRKQRRQQMIQATDTLSGEVGKRAACEALEVPRATFYRHLNPGKSEARRPEPPLALSLSERQTVLSVLHSERFQDRAPLEVYATLLDEGCYLCSPRTMYRILDAEHGDVKERRWHVQRPPYRKPELLATEPNQVWSWDITKLRGAAKWTYFYLYVILDIFSRYVVGWMVAHCEQKALAKRLIEQSCRKQQIAPGQLTVHADRGSSMKSKVVAQLLADLGVTKTHSRPHVSNDNPYSESQFKTLKYCPRFPQQFGSIQDSRAFCQDFFSWYNKEHRHSGIALMTPEQVHYGRNDEVTRNRAAVLTAAFEKHPNRFKNKIPVPDTLPEAVWINPPSTDNGGA